MTIKIPAAERRRIDLDDKRGTALRRARLLLIAVNGLLEKEEPRLAGISDVGAVDEAALVLEQAFNDLDAHHLTSPA